MGENKNEIDIREELLSLDEPPAPITWLLGGDDEKMERIAEHRLQLASIRKQYPHPAHPYKIGVYIRYFNQTKHENYLEKHIAHFKEAIDLCPRWTLVDFYIDEGQTAPNMENAPEWCRLLEDCFDGKVDLILTQKVSNVCRKDKPEMLTFIAGILASQPHPIGMYFVSENSQMALTFQSTMAEEESHTRSRSMESSLRMRLDNGLPLTPPLLGYLQNADGKLVINPDEKNTVKLAFYTSCFS